MNGLIEGIPLITDFYVLFHFALKEGGAWELLLTMFAVVLELFAIEYRRRFIAQTIARYSK